MAIHAMRDHAVNQRRQRIHHPHIVHIHVTGIDCRIDLCAVLRFIHAGIQNGAINLPVLAAGGIYGRCQGRCIGDVAGCGVQSPTTGLE